VTAFHPDYKMDESAGYHHGTFVETLLRAYDIGKEAGLWFVYAGNLPGEVGHREDTCCPHCGGVAIRRRGFTVLEITMNGDCCRKCGRRIPGYWNGANQVASTQRGVPSGALAAASRLNNSSHLPEGAQP
jgi:pyruvate formate lyase activating enzyme